MDASNKLRGRQPAKINFNVGNRHFTANEIVNRYKNIKKPVTLATILKHLHAGVENGTVQIVGKKTSENRGPRRILFKNVAA